MLSVLFVHIRGFTSLAEQTSPTDIAVQLDRFYDLASKATFRHDCTLDKLVGDQVMAFFGPPLNHENHARRAVTTALEISRAIGEFAAGKALALGVGITTGEAFVAMSAAVM